MDDKIIRAMLFDNQAYAIAISGKNTVETARKLHNTTPVCTAALGRVMMASLLCAAELKNDGDVTVTFNGNGPAGRCVAVATPEGTVRGYLDNPNIDLPPNQAGKLDVSGALGKNGLLTVIKDIGEKEPYVGQVKIQTGEVAEDFAYYFAVSEQKPCFVYLGVIVDTDYSVLSAAGLFAYPLPGCGEETIEKLEASAKKAQFLARHLAENRKIEDCLSIIFDDIKITESYGCEYKCNCSRERIESAIISLGEAELKSIIEEDQKAQIICHFCNSEYNFSKGELEKLLYEGK